MGHQKKYVFSKIILSLFIAFSFVVDDGFFHIQAKDNPSSGTETVTYQDNEFAFGSNQLAFIDNHNDLYVSVLSLYLFHQDSENEYNWDTNDNLLHPKKIMSNVKSVSYARNILYFLKTDGSVWTYGYFDEEKQKFLSKREPTKVLDDVVKLGSYNEKNISFAAIKKDGSLWTWGENSEYNGLLQGEGKGSSMPVQVMESVKDILFIGYSGRSFVLKDNGNLLDNYEQKIILNGVKQIYIENSGNTYAYFAIKNDNSLWTWGNNTYGQLGNGDSTFSEQNIPQKIAEDVDISFVGKTSGFIKKDGSMYAMGLYWASTTGGGFDPEKRIFEIDGLKFNSSNSNFMKNKIWLYPDDCIIEPVQISTRKYKKLNYGENGILYIDSDNVLHYKGRYCTNSYSQDYTNETILTDNVKSDNNTTVNRPSFSVTKEEIFKEYPESLTNETDDLLSASYQHSISLLSKRNTTSDFLTAFKYLTDLKNLDTVIKSLAMGNEKIYNEYLDKILIELLNETNNTDIIVVDLKESTKDTKEKFSKFKTAYGLCKTALQKQEVVMQYRNLLRIKNENEADVLIKKLKSFDDELKTINRALDVWDIYLLSLQIMNINSDNMALLKDTFPKKSTIYKRLEYLESIMSNQDLIVLDTTLDYILDECFKFITDMGDDITNFLLTGELGSLSFQYKLAKVSLKLLGKLIKATGFDDIMNATIYSSINGSLFTELALKRKEFLQYKTSQNYPKSFKKEIAIYEALYKITCKGFIKQLKALKDEGSKADKETTQEFIKLLEVSTFDNYLNNCVRQIRNKVLLDSPFEYIIINDEIHITKVNKKEKNIQLLTEGIYEGEVNNHYLIIPNTIDDLPVVSIENGAIENQYSAIILEENIISINESMKNLSQLKYLKTGSKLKLSTKEQIPSTVQEIFTTSENVYTYLKGTIPTKLTIGDIISIRVIQNPKDMKYYPNKTYNSEGLKLEITDSNNKSEILDAGWLEYLSFDNDKAILHLVYGGVETEINLVPQSVVSKYKITCINENGDVIKEDVKQAEYLTELSVEPPKLNNYESIDSKKIILLNEFDNELVFNYKQILGFDEKVYTLNKNQEKTININNINDDVVTLYSENPDVVKIIGNNIIGVNSGSTYIKAQDSEGNNVKAYVLVNKGKLEIPAAPTLKSKTDTTIIIHKIHGQEYSLDGKTWSNSNVFDGLKPATDYQIYTRIAETNDTEVSEVSSPLKVRTKKSKPIVSKEDIHHVTQSGASDGFITGLKAEIEYSLDEGKLWEKVVDKGTITNLSAGKILIRNASSSDLLNDESEIVIIYIKEPSKTPNKEQLKVSNVSKYGGRDGKITGLSKDMEYSLDNGVTWKDAIDQTLNGLQRGKVRIRYKATEKNLASEAIVMTIKEPSKTPDKEQLNVSNVSKYGGRDGKITGLSKDMEYSLENGITWKDAIDQTLTGLQRGKVRIRYKATEKNLASEAIVMTIKEPSKSLKKDDISIKQINKYGADNGCIYVNVRNVEYSLDEGKTWHAVNNNKITGLRAGDVFLRTIMTDFNIEGEILVVTLIQPEKEGVSTGDNISIMPNMIFLSVIFLFITILNKRKQSMS